MIDYLIDGDRWIHHDGGKVTFYQYGESLSFKSWETVESAAEEIAEFLSRKPTPEYVAKSLLQKNTGVYLRAFTRKGEVLITVPAGHGFGKKISHLGMVVYFRVEGRAFKGMEEWQEVSATSLPQRLAW